MYYKIAKLLCGIYYAVFFKLNIIGIENLPKEGAYIACSNHVSNYDVITLTLAMGRLPSYLAKIQLFKNKLFAHVLLKLNAIPVDREKADLTAYRKVLDELKRGGAVGIFAHGTRMRDAEAKDAKAGVALFAVKSGAPVIPIGIVSTYKLFQKVTVIFGTPIDFSEYKGKKVGSEELSEISTSIMKKVEELIDGFESAGKERS